MRSERQLGLLLLGLLLVEPMILVRWSDALATPTNGNCVRPTPASRTTVDSLDAFVQMRSGIRPDAAPGVFGDVVFWTADGELYESPSGTLLARIQGLETSRAVRLEEDDAVRIFSRKLVWFLHPDTGEILHEFRGQAVPPIRYDAQVFDMKRGEPLRLDDNPVDSSLSPILPFVVKSKRLVPCMPITPRWGGGSKTVLMFQVPLFIDIDIPVVDGSDPHQTRRYQAWEFYDYCWTVHPNLQRQHPPLLSWMRQGSVPPFCRDGNGVLHARGHRVDSFDELPQSTRDYVNQKYPLFRGPPTTMEEVDRLLNGETS